MMQRLLICVGDSVVVWEETRSIKGLPGVFGLLSATFFGVRGKGRPATFFGVQHQSRSATFFGAHGYVSRGNQLHFSRYVATFLGVHQSAIGYIFRGLAGRLTLPCPAPLAWSS